jgi:hypothetical protein
VVEVVFKEVRKQHMMHELTVVEVAEQHIIQTPNEAVMAAPVLS